MDLGLQLGKIKSARGEWARLLMGVNTEVTNNSVLNGIRSLAVISQIFPMISMAVSQQINVHML